MTSALSGFRTVAIGAASALTFLWLAASASAATITPNTFADEYGEGGSCGLREAVQAANADAPFGGCPAGSGADTIELSEGTYNLTRPGANEQANATGDLDITANSTVTISHAGISRTTINANGLDRTVELQVPTAFLTIIGLNITNGVAGAVSDGGGGGVRNSGGGGLTISNTTVSGNRVLAGFQGGGISTNTNAVLTNVTVSGNNSATNGGGFFAAVNLTLNNVTVSGNSAAGNGGGLFTTTAGTSFNNTLFAGNTDDNNSSPDCSSGFAITSLGNNLIGNTTGCNFTAAGGDLLNVNPLLGPLADNGGSTSTHALAKGSPAINAGGPDSAPFDQRGVARSPDIGAYEFATCGGKVVNRVGTEGKDKLKGTSGADGILALGGKDTLKGLKGKDGLCGGNGKDKLKGGGSKDKLIGGKGADKLLGGGGNDVCKGGKGKDTLTSC